MTEQRSSSTHIIPALVRLTRPGNAVICGLSVITGSVITGQPSVMLMNLFRTPTDSWALRIWSAALSAALILAAGNAFNDVCDVATDRVNAPGRPIPSGAISVHTAGLWAALLALAGLVFAIPLALPGVGRDTTALQGGPWGPLIAVAAVLLLVLYDTRLKRVPFAGNMVVALLGGVAFLYGGVAGGAVQRSMVPAGLAVLFHLAREIVKDAADVRGDSAAGMRTLATEYGTYSAARLAGWVIALLGIVTGLPWLTGYFGHRYFLVILVGVWPVLAHAIRVLIHHPAEADMVRLSMVLKLDMPVGLIAVLAGYQWG